MLNWQGQNCHKLKKHAENFKFYFSAIASSILKERKYEGNRSFKDFLKAPLEHSLVFDPCDEDEVLAIICKINRNKAIGPNSIPTNILHLISHSIAKSLVSIINGILS